MRYVIGLVAALALSVAAVPAHAQGRGNSGTHGNAPQTGAPATHGGGHAPDTPKPNAGAPTQHGGAAEPAETHSGKHGTTTTTTTTVTSTTPTSHHANDQLAAKLQPLLPAGTNINDAASGFKNWGQFVAAVHVSHNLNIPFADLKAKMTGAQPLSLGQAIQALQPSTTTTTSTRVRREVETAESEADEDLRTTHK
jgi:hypothetical protein